MFAVEMYARVRRACMVEGMSVREASRVFGLHRDTVRKMLAYSVPPGYRRQDPPRRPKLEPFTGVIDGILEADHRVPRKQRHTAKRIFERLRDEHGFDGGYTTVGEQKQHANEQAPREGYRFIQEFEEVKSAATDKRPAFLEMVSLAISPNRPAEAIFFHDMARAFRNDEDFYMYRRMLREANVKIFTYEEGELKNDDQSQLMFGFKSLLNSQVPRKTARETRRGQFGATRRGFYLGLGVFGYEKYKVMDGGVEHIKLQPHPTQWEHLLSMFRMALENHGGRRIADHLNSLGVKTRLGNDWNESTVLGVLRNPACRGKTHRGENSRSPYLDRSEQVFCENAHEAAVSEEDYQTIERLIKLRTTAPGGPRAHSSPKPPQRPRKMRAMRVEHDPEQDQGNHDPGLLQ